MVSDTSEKQFQKDFWSYLVDTGYKKRTTKDYHVATCLDVELVLDFVKSSQPNSWKKFRKVYNDKAEVKFIESLVRNLDKYGTIDTLRNGFRDIAPFKLFYPMPNNNLNPELEEKFKHNIFSIIDELEYEDKAHGNRLDLVIFINGIPISTIELKDTFSQGVINAIEQYRTDRNPNEPIFKRTLIHFAMSDEKIYMTTKLAGEKTFFLPFNKGIENPVVKNNYKTSYLYTDILQPNQLSKLIYNFIFTEVDKETKKEKTIFPRFHQLDCVNQLLKGPKPGRNYLIQHSAGSGKTKTIAWLAHGLLNKFDENDKRIYDMVVVVSDRKVIDGQLQDQVKAIERKIGVVEKIDKDSNQLAEAITTGTNIVVTTLHKFSYILEKISDVEERNYAVIIDEAHSSQTGSHAKNLRRGLSAKVADEDVLDEAEDDVDEQILKDLEKIRDTSNISFFAFTATPKAKTLEMFGYEDEAGQFRPHHLYSMKQAIEEHFILDVLENYITYPTYFKLIKTATEDPKYDEVKAKRYLRQFVEENPNTIHKKTKIILNHFMENTIHKIKGQARAMLVTGSRKQAVLYKLEMDRQIDEEGLPIRTLVAFTGTIEHDTKEYTEDNMNELGKMKIEDALKEDPYRILIVANKYQTGFDEPLLHTMFVDKKLNGVKAVQTLSRVNRIHDNKDDTLILDFANDKEVIRKSFEPYYGETYLAEATDYHKLYDLYGSIYGYGIFDENEVDAFIKAYMNNRPQAELHNRLAPPRDKFYALPELEQTEFRKYVNRFHNIYSFMCQLLPFSDLDLEKLYIYTKILIVKIPPDNEPPLDILRYVDMDSYKIDDSDEGSSITLMIDGELKPASPTGPRYEEDEKTPLSEIIDELNETFKTDFTEDDKVNFEQLFTKVLNNEELGEKVEHNSRENVEAIFDQYFDDAMNDLLDSHFNFYKKINDDENLKKQIKELLLKRVYDEREVKV